MNSIRLFFRNRPVLCAALSYIAGIAFAGELNELIIAALVVASVTALILILFPQKPKKPIKYARIIVCFAAFSVGLLYTAGILANVIEIDEKDAFVTATVERVIDGDTFLVRNINVNGMPLDGGALVYVSVYGGKRPPAVLPGQTVTIKGASVFTPSEARMPYGFDFQKYALSVGANKAVSVSLSDSSGSGEIAVSGGRNLLMGSAQIMRNALGKKIEILFGENADLIKALTIGVKEDVDPQTLEDFSKSGAAHLLAVSGMQAGIIAMMILFIVRKLPVGFRVRRVISAAGLFFYCMVAGMSPSIVRAVLMTAFFYGGQMFFRESDSFTSLSVAALVILIVNPMTLYSVGFQMSSMAVIGIGTLTPRVKKFIRAKDGYAAQIVSMTLAVNLATLPILLLYFDELSIVQLVSGMLMIPLSTVAIWFSLPAALLSFFLPIGIVRYIAAPAYVCVSLTRYCAKVFAALPFSTVNLHAPGFAVTAVYYLALYLRFPKRKTSAAVKTFLFSASLALFIAAPFLNRPENFQMISYDIGYGDATLLRYKGSSVLVDCGEADARLYHSLRAQGISLDIFVLTHGHTDHGGGLKNIVNYVKVNEIVIWHGSDFSRYSEEILEGLRLAAAKGIRITLVGAGETFSAGEIEFETISPMYFSKDENDNSLILIASCGGSSVLLTGDAEKKSEVYGSVKADVLKVGHHGSDTSSSGDFLDAVSPKLAVISVGRNAYGHPSPKVLGRLEERGIDVITTIENGTFTVSFGENGSISVRSANNTSVGKQVRDWITRLFSSK